MHDLEKLKRNQKIRVNIKGESYRVRVLKVREELNGGWFLKVRFESGITRDLAVNRQPLHTRAKGKERSYGNQTDTRYLSVLPILCGG